MHSCIFCAIIDKKVPATVVAENNDVIVIKDIAPRAPTHYLIIPKKHFKDISELTTSDSHMPTAMLFMAQELAKTLSGSQAYRLIVNNGSDAGQKVFHLHIHFLSGQTMLDF